METSIPNHRTATHITPEIVQDHFVQARTSYSNSREQAGRAAALCYMAYRDTRSTDMRRWLDERFGSYNAEVDKHNQTEKALKARVRQFSKGDLPKDDVLMTAVNTEAERLVVEEDRASLTALVDLSDKDWDARRQVKIDLDMPSGSMFVPIVKLGLNLRYRKDASTIARMAKCCEFLHHEFASKVVDSLEELCNAIKAAGGFDHAIAQARGDDDDHDSPSDEIQQKIESRLIGNSRNALVQAVPKGDVEVAFPGKAGIVAAIGRHDGTTFSLVTVLDLEDAALDRLLLEVRDDQIMPPIPRTAFLAQLAALGELVKQGEVTGTRENGLTSGRRLKTRRVLSVLPGHSSAEWLVSAQLADSCIVVSGKPAPDLGLPSVTEPKILDAAATSTLFQPLLHRASANAYTVEMTEQELIELFAEPSVEPQASVHLGPLAKVDTKPLDTVNFKPIEAVEVSLADLREFYQRALSDWRGRKTEKQISKVATLAFSDTVMTYSLEGQEDVHLPFDGGSEEHAYSVLVRAKDLHDVVSALLQVRGAPTVTVQADTGGLVRFGWTDQFGEFRVDLPTASVEGTLITRRVEPIQL